jgi:hypothetical protein
VSKDKTPALKPSVGKHRLAADLFVALVARHGVLRPTNQEAQNMASVAYLYADAFVREGDKWQ